MRNPIQIIVLAGAFLISGWFSVADAQEIAISDPQKITTELTGYSIMGKNKNGDVLVYKKYRFKDEIDIYDKNMSFKRRKEISVREDSETLEFYKSGDYIFQFFTNRDNKMLYLFVQQYTTDLDKKCDPVLLDSTSQRIGDNYSDFKVIQARTAPYYLIYKNELSNGRIDKLITLVMDENMRIIQQSLVNLPDINFTPVQIKAFISEDGTPVFLYRNDDFRCKNEKTAVQYLYVLPKGGTGAVTTEMGGSDYCFEEMQFGYDQMHNQIISVHFLKEDQKDHMIGYQFSIIDPASGAITLSHDYIFPPETQDDIIGINKERSSTNIPVYQIGSIIPRADGGALVVAEYYDKTVENFEFTNYDPYYGYRTSVRQVEFYEYDDILLFSIQPDGTPSWNTVIRKKQVSREDRGVNSSYALVNIKDKCMFIFNEDIEQNANVLEYVMTATGELDRNSLFNANQQEVQIRPSSAQQISYNEIVIPSIYKKSLSFVKIKF